MPTSNAEIKKYNEELARKKKLLEDGILDRQENMKKIETKYLENKNKIKLSHFKEYTGLKIKIDALFKIIEEYQRGTILISKKYIPECKDDSKKELLENFFDMYLKELLKYKETIQKIAEEVAKIQYGEDTKRIKSLKVKFKEYNKKCKEIAVNILSPSLTLLEAEKYEKFLGEFDEFIKEAEKITDKLEKYASKSVEAPAKENDFSGINDKLDKINSNIVNNNEYFINIANEFYEKPEAYGCLKTFLAKISDSLPVTKIIEKLAEEIIKEVAKKVGNLVL